MRIKAGRIWLTTWKTCSRTSEKNIKLFLVKYLARFAGAVEYSDRTAGGRVREFFTFNVRGKVEYDVKGIRYPYPWVFRAVVLRCSQICFAIHEQFSR